MGGVKGNPLLNRRRFMNSLFDSKIEYLEVPENGKAYIDTEYIPQGNDYDIYCRFEVLRYTEANSHIFGAWTLDGSSIYAYIAKGGYNNSQRFECYNGSKGYSSVISVDINYGEVYDSYILHDGTYKFNDVEGKIDIIPAVTQNINSLKLFCTDYSLSRGGYKHYKRIYSFSLYKLGVPVLDLIPVRIGDQGYMYDNVSNRLLKNESGGVFLLGPDVK